MCVCVGGGRKKCGGEGEMGDLNWVSRSHISMVERPLRNRDGGLGGGGGERQIICTKDSEIIIYCFPHKTLRRLTFCSCYFCFHFPTPSWLFSSVFLLKLASYNSSTVFWSLFFTSLLFFCPVWNFFISSCPKLNYINLLLSYFLSAPFSPYRVYYTKSLFCTTCVNPNQNGQGWKWPCCVF